MLYGLGLSHEQNNYAVSEFSGGWRMRLNLAQTLMSRSDILLSRRTDKSLGFGCINLAGAMVGKL